MTEDVSLRDVESADLDVFYLHQQDPAANRMAAFPARGRDAFIQHWHGILADDQVFKQTIMAAGDVAGNVVCFQRSDELLLGYWLGQDYWGQGIATRAVGMFVQTIPTRPIHAYVAKQNVASQRVLEKCGFEQLAEIKADAGGVDEYKYSLGASRTP